MQRTSKVQTVHQHVESAFHPSHEKTKKLSCSLGANGPMLKADPITFIPTRHLFNCSYCMPLLFRQSQQEFNRAHTPTSWHKSLLVVIFSPTRKSSCTPSCTFTVRMPVLIHVDLVDGLGKEQRSRTQTRCPAIQGHDVSNPVAFPFVVSSSATSDHDFQHASSVAE
eukprot:1236603-Amphidinium_carterae.1